MAPAYLVQTGPLLIGGVLSCFFFGAFFIQLFTYALDFARVDRKRFVALVSLVSIIETVHLAFTAHTIYGMLVTHYGDAETLGTAPWSASALPTLNAAVSLCVQMFFAWRVKLLGKSVLSLGASIAIGLLALVQCGAAIAVTVEFNRMGLRIDATKSLRTMVIIWLGGTVACDVLMTVSIIVVLMVYRRSAVFQVSKNLVDTFVFHTIENGALTAVCAALNLIFFLVFPNNYLFICVELILGRLYANVLLATLNRRDRRSVTGSSEHDASAKSTSQRAVPLQSFRPSRTNNGNNHTNRISQVPPVPMYPAMVSITREVHVDHDDGASNFSNHDEKRPDYPAAV